MTVRKSAALDRRDGDCRFRGNVFALTTANRPGRVEIGARTLVPKWYGENMDDAMAVEGLMQRE
jgi:hypothetical protein